MLAHGDSWFDYPLDGNAPTLSDTDVIAQLRSMGRVNPIILNLSHHGDATTDELSWPKQKRMIDALNDTANWLSSGKPDAILFSGGGNDIAGEHFCIYLDYASEGHRGLNDARFAEALEGIKASYQDLFAFRNEYARGIPIFGQCYDFAIPNGTHPLCVGPWLKPAFEFAGYIDFNQNRTTMRDVLTRFKGMLETLVDEGFLLIDTQNTLVVGDWANELHPHPGGFKKIAEKFVEALGGHFRDRI
jgi:hypothetical protein